LIIELFEFLENPNFEPFVSLRSDRVLIAEKKNNFRYFALEYERTAKSRARYIEKFRDYYESSKISIVLYVCKGKSFCEKLKDVDRQVCDTQRPMFYFCDLDDFLNEERKMIFSNSKDEIIDLG